MSSTYDFAIVRVVPRVERGEQINVGVVLSCATAEFLGARVSLDEDRLRALAPDIDVEQVRQALQIFEWIAAGDPRGGPIAELPRGERFHWLIAPRSTIIQPSPVHTGLCSDPQDALDSLLRRLVK